MSARQILDDPKWKYPGGSCRLQVWQENVPSGITTLALLIDSKSSSIENAIEAIAKQLTRRFGDLDLVQHTTGSPGSTSYFLLDGDNRPLRCSASLGEVAANLGVSARELIS